MDKNLIPSASTGESKVSYYKMKSDDNRLPAECGHWRCQEQGRRGGCGCASGGAEAGADDSERTEDCGGSTGAVHWQDR